MAISLVILFIICITLSFYEERFIKRDKVIICVLIGIALIFIAGTRGIYDTPDSWEYEETNHNL